MTTYYVDVAVGADGNAGTSEGAGNAWASIGKAMNTVAAGDFVYVKASGEYAAEDAATDAVGQIDTAGTTTSWIVFEGYTTTPGDVTYAAVTLNAGTNALANCINTSLASVNAFNAFRGFRFTGGSADGVSLPNPEYFLFSLCRFDNNGGDGLEGDNNYTFERCQFDNNTGDGVSIDYYAQIFYCVSHTNGNYGFKFSGSSVAVGCLGYNNGANAFWSGSLQGAWINCTADGENVQGGFELNLHGHVVANCIVYDCDVGIHGVSAGGESVATSLNNLFHSNGADRTNWPADASDVTGDPLFVDEASDDYRLLNDSPALVAGLDVGETVAGLSYMDIGAHQRNPDAVVSVATGYFDPIIAYGKLNQHVLTGSDKPTAGDTVFTFNNAFSPIDVGDHVLSSNQDDAVNQYLGICTLSSIAGITVSIAVQTTPVTSLKIWKPTEFAFFNYGEATGGQAPREIFGTTPLVTRGAKGLPMKHSDSLRVVQLAFNPLLETDEADIKTFLVTNRDGGSKAFSLGWYDHFGATARVSKVFIASTGYTARMRDKITASMTLTFTLEDLDFYVTA